jgi:uracil-DNA glycosylase family 4
VPETTNQENTLEALQQEINQCKACPRLIKWCQQVSKEKVARFANENYWGQPVPSFGDPKARIVLLGLAPAAHGGNRTGRVFTGDRSGDFLYSSLHRLGLANQPTSKAKGDGLALIDTYISLINHCAPPANKPTPQERDKCLPFLSRELLLLTSVKVILAFGAYAWDGALRVLSANGYTKKPTPKFGHAAEVLVGPYVLLGCFHPSQQNTFTGRLTPTMLDAVIQRAKLVSSASPEGGSPAGRAK